MDHIRQTGVLHMFLRKEKASFRIYSWQVLIVKIEKEPTAGPLAGETDENDYQIQF